MPATVEVNHQVEDQNDVEDQNHVDIAKASIDDSKGAPLSTSKRNNGKEAKDIDENLSHNPPRETSSHMPSIPFNSFISFGCFIF